MPAAAAVPEAAGEAEAAAVPAAEPGAAGTSRQAKTSPSRTASCGSSEPSAAAGEPAQSTSWNRPGCSDCADRTRPHTAAPGRSRTSSPALAATAPPVTRTRRLSANRSSASHSCSSARTRRTSSWTADADADASPGGAHRVTTSAGAGRPPSTAARSAARSWWHGATTGRPSAGPTTTGSGTSPSGAGTRVQSRRYSASRGATPAAPPSRASAATGLSVSDRTSATGRPAMSATWSVTLSGPVGVSRARTPVAPTAWSVTPPQENGSRADPPSPGTGESADPSTPRAMACSTESARAGCSRKVSAASDASDASGPANAGSPCGEPASSAST
jgi:hypothetical protein